MNKKKHSSPNITDRFIFTLPIVEADELLPIIRRRYMYDFYVAAIHTERGVKEIWARQISKHMTSLVREGVQMWLIGKGIIG